MDLSPHFHEHFKLVYSPEFMRIDLMFSFGSNPETGMIARGSHFYLFMLLRPLNWC